jgi:transcriptional regulator with GAF, ATPase, and Fis domain
MDTGEGHIRFDNPLLPYTRSEIALPLIAGDNVLGALDAQSTREADFNAQDIETLKTVAYQVAVALENARLYQSARQNLQDMQAIQRQYLLTSWENFAEEKGSVSYEIGESEQLLRWKMPVWWKKGKPQLGVSVWLPRLPGRSGHPQPSTEYYKPW